MNLIGHALFLVSLLEPAFGASLTVDSSGYLTDIGTPVTAGVRGSFQLNPAGVLGYSNFGGATYTPTHSGGGIGLALSSVGSFALQGLTGIRYSDSVSGVLDTDSVRGATAIHTGYRFSLVPGSIGDFSFSVHLADNKANVGYTVTQGGSVVGTPGLLPNSAAVYDEGVVTFHFNVANSTEAAATWTFDLTHESTVSGAAIAIGGAWIVAGTPPEPPSSVAGLGRLVCIGDSITEAKGTRPVGEGNWSWRYWCWQNFVDFGIAHQFVGTRASNNGGSSVYPDYSSMAFTNRHEAIWGTTFSERATSAPTFLGSLKTSGLTPDTAVIFGGGNDVPLDLSVPAATVRDRTKTIVDHLQGDLGTAGNPNIRILLVSILPRFAAAPPSSTTDVRNPRYSEINTLLAALATSETTATSKVEYLDVYPLFTSPTDALLYDGVHPGGKGEQLLGNAIFAALVPDIEPVSLRIDSVNLPAHAVNFSVRTHGPRQVRIESSADLSDSSWTTVVPQSLNPGEWEPATYTHGSTLPSRWFFRAVAP